MNRIIFMWRVSENVFDLIWDSLGPVYTLHTVYKSWNRYHLNLCRHGILVCICALVFLWHFARLLLKIRSIISLFCVAAAKLTLLCLFCSFFGFIKITSYKKRTIIIITTTTEKGWIKFNRLISTLSCCCLFVSKSVVYLFFW